MVKLAEKAGRAVRGTRKGVLRSKYGLFKKSKTAGLAVSALNSVRATKPEEATPKLVITKTKKTTVENLRAAKAKAKATGYAGMATNGLSDDELRKLLFGR